MNHIVTQKSWGWIALAAACLAGCSKTDPGTADGGATGDGGATVDAAALADRGTTADQRASDAPPPKKLKVTQLIPTDGPANGGTGGTIPVTAIGEGFAAGIAVYVDGGQEIITTVQVSSATSLRFNLPKNPYGKPDYDKPAKVTIQLRLGGSASNTVDFQYTVPAAASDDFKGSVVTSSARAFRDFKSEPFEGKIYVKGVTDTTTGAAKVRAEVGFTTKAGAIPGQDHSYRWSVATFSKDDGLYDVYTGSVVPTLEGTVQIAYRFSQDDGQSWLYVDTKEDDGKFLAADTAKLTVTLPPDGFCVDSSNCLIQRFAVVCKVHPTDWTQSRCVQCLEAKDCTANTGALGPKCDTTKNMCFCEGAADCASSPNGKTCIKGASYCGCTGDPDCKSPLTCAQDPKTKLQMCMSN
ncbi:MAG: hypothetical protein IT371_28260 [Deltaproteobacteria bacterium]|nr:hypothetical protein [Deltaproteobacteria bacterium]